MNLRQRQRRISIVFGNHSCCRWFHLLLFLQRKFLRSCTLLYSLISFSFVSLTILLFFTEEKCVCASPLRSPTVDHATIHRVYNGHIVCVFLVVCLCIQICVRPSIALLFCNLVSIRKCLSFRNSHNKQQT